MVRLRFIQLTESSAPDAPFQPGQVITLPALTNDAYRWVKYRQAVIVPNEPERAVVPAAEQAVSQGRAPVAAAVDVPEVAAVEPRPVEAEAEPQQSPAQHGSRKRASRHK